MELVARNLLEAKLVGRNPTFSPLIKHKPDGDPMFLTTQSVLWGYFPLPKLGRAHLLVDFQRGAFLTFTHHSRTFNCTSKEAVTATEESTTAHF